MCFKIDWAALWLEGNLPFLLCFTLYLRAISKYKAPGEGGGGLIFRGVIRGVIYYGIIFIIDAGHHKIDFLSFSSHLLVHCICHHQ